MNQVDESSGPERLTLWWCIGCGAMGNAAECAGTCDFKGHFIVEAGRHADLLDYCFNLADRNEALRQFSSEITAETDDSRRFAHALIRLRSRAKVLLAPAPIEAPPQAAPDDERAEIWLCACCGQVEALRDLAIYYQAFAMLKSMEMSFR